MLQNLSYIKNIITLAVHMLHVNINNLVCNWKLERRGESNSISAGPVGSTCEASELGDGTEYVWYCRINTF